MTAEFSLSLQAYESNDIATGDFLDIRVAVTCRDFAGRTLFCLARRDLDTFIADLAALKESRCDSAVLLGGWDEAEARLRLQITPAGRSGRFLTRVRIANTGPRTDQWHHVETEFVSLPDAVSAFEVGLRQLVDRRAPGDASLAGDPEAIA